MDPTTFERHSRVLSQGITPFKGEDEIVCCVCNLHVKNLPDKESIITDNVYSEGGVHSGDSPVRLHGEFQHCIDEQGNSGQPHERCRVIVAECGNNRTWTLLTYGST